MKKKNRVQEFRIVRIDDPEALDYIARCEVYQAISDYEIWRRILLKDPTDPDACRMMEDCRDFLLTDPRVDRCIEDSVEFLWELDRKVDKDIREWWKSCSR